MLGDGLPRRAEPVPGDQPGAQLEQRLAVPFLELVEDRAPGRVREGLEHVAHGLNIGKYHLPDKGYGSVTYWPRNARAVAVSRR